MPTPLSDGDLPVSDVVRDDETHTLYVGTDFGVLQGINDGATAGTSRGACLATRSCTSRSSRRTRAPTCTGGGHCKRILYAATHSQGIWEMNLGGDPGHHGHGHHGHGHHGHGHGH